MKGNLCRDYSDTTVFGEGSIQHDRSARFTGKPYDEDLQAFVFPYRNYNPVAARWMSADPVGYPDGPNNHYYAANPTFQIDLWGLKIEYEGKDDEQNKQIGDILKWMSEDSSTIKDIIEQLEKSEHTHTISMEPNSTEGNRITFTDPEGANDPNKGSGSHITFDPNSQNSSVFGNGWNRPPELGLAHELVHAQQANQGRITTESAIEHEARYVTNKVLSEMQESGSVSPTVTPRPLK